MVLRELLQRAKSSRPAWISVGVLAWLAAVAAAVAATLMWLNLRGFPRALRRGRARGASRSAPARPTASAVVLLGIAVAHYSFGRRGSRVGAALLVDRHHRLAGAAARGARRRRRAAARRAARRRWPPPPARQRPAHHAAARSTARRSTTSGRASPRAGCRTSAGCSTPARRWTWRRCGRRSPIRSGRRSPPACSRRRTACAPPASYLRPRRRAADRSPARSLLLARARAARLLRDEPNTSATLRARPLWSILSDYGFSAGVVGWPLTYPAAAVHGFLVTDRFHQLSARCSSSTATSAYPADIRAGSPRERVRRDRRGVAAVGRVLQPRAAGRRGRAPGAADAIRYQGARYRRPLFPALRAAAAAFGDVHRRRAPALGAGARSRVCGDRRRRSARAHRAPERRAICCWSCPGSACSRSARSNGWSAAAGRSRHQRHARSGARRLPAGLRRPGRRRPQPRGSMVDVTPTILYFLGLPIGRDMDGYARADLFEPRSPTSGRSPSFLLTAGSTDTDPGS